MTVPALPNFLDVSQEFLRLALPSLLQQGLRGQGQRVEPTTPVIVDQIVKQIAGVVQMGLLKQIAALQRKTAEHATAPSMDSEDGRVIHVLCSRMALCSRLGPALLCQRLAQIMQKRVSFWRSLSP